MLRGRGGCYKNTSAHTCSTAQHMRTSDSDAGIRSCTTSSCLLPPALVSAASMASNRISAWRSATDEQTTSRASSTLPSLTLRSQCPARVLLQMTPSLACGQLSPTVTAIPISLD